MASLPPQRRWYHRIGPGLITACVVIGPGSILASSQVGATEGYGMAWVAVTAVCFMLIYMGLGAKLGVVSRETPGGLIAARAGRWLAVLIGLGVFFISAAFQVGNSLGVGSAIEVYFPDPQVRQWLVVGFNGLTILFLFGFRNLYKAVERLMMTFVAVMLLAFALNLAFARPDLGELALGFVPGTRGGADISVLGMIATTFVITAAFFQSYLAQGKGWTKADLRDGQADACVGSIIMLCITLMLISTAAAVLRSQSLEDVTHVAASLEPLFGPKGQLLFCLGLFSAAYSSFLVNSMIGGTVLSDGLGWGGRPSDLGPRLLTSFLLLGSMGVALYLDHLDIGAVPAIIAAQAVTVIAAPLVAGTLLWLSNSRDVMGDDRTEPVMNVFAGLGFLLLLAVSYYTATAEVWPAVQKWLNGSTAG